MSVRLLRWMMALAALLGSLQATAAIKDQAADGFTIEHSQWVPVDQATAWKAFVHDVGKWWPADHTWWGDASKLSISEQVGGCFCELNGAQQARHMGVAFVDPGKLMRMTGGLGPLQGMGLNGVMEWRFVAENGGTRITITGTGFPIDRDRTSTLLGFDGPTGNTYGSIATPAHGL